jgi:Tfp pilus assembly protein PilO
VRDRRPFWRRRLLYPVLGLLGLNVVALVGFTLPRRLEVRSTAQRVAELEGEVARQRRVTLALRAEAEVAEANEADLTRFYDSLVCRDDAELLEILEELERTVAEVGLAPANRQYDYDLEPLRGTPLERIRISLPASGSYAQLGALLERLERSKRFVVVDQVLLREVASSGELNVTLSAFCRADEEPAA